MSAAPAVIGVDASRITVADRTGTENYALQLLRHLLRLPGQHEWRLYFRDAPQPNLLPHSARAQQRVLALPRLWTHAALASALWRDPPAGLFIPAHMRPLFCAVPAVVTVHDLGFRHFPATHTASQRLYLNWSTRHNARHATHLIADSHATRRDLMEQYGVSAERVTVVYPGFDALPFANAQRSPRLPGLPANYLLHVGTLQPRKNLTRLMDALAAVRMHPSPPELVLAGRSGWLSAPIRQHAAALGLGDRIHFLDYVPEADLPALYAHATACVLPSLYEGFGFTLLEAMACGTPVICSNGGSLPEVAGGAALQFEATDTAALAHAITRVLDNAALRAQLVARGADRVRCFTWEQCAAQTLAVLERAFQLSPTAPAH